MIVENREEQATESEKLNTHPLDPLSFSEINTVVSIVKDKAELGKELLFETIVLREPSKEDVLSFLPGIKLPREAFVVVLNYKKEEVYELVVSLDEGQILDCEHISGVQPAFLFGDLNMDFNEWEHGVKHDPKFVEALRKRGIENPDLVMIDPWPISNFGNKEEEGKRLAGNR